MGLNADTIRLVARLLRGHSLKGGAVTFGVQKVGGDYGGVAKLLEAEGYPWTRLEPTEIRPDELAGGKERIHQDTLFRMLGFETVDSIDYFPNEKPSHVLDLNRPLPEELWGRYSLVCDGGTIEHCFDVPEALANVVRLLRTGGLALHVSPLSGWIQHGFYQFSPNLFFDFYATNGFGGLSAKIQFEGRCIDVRDHVPRRDFLGRKALLVFVAEKTEEVDAIRAPIQNAYRAKFEGSPELRLSAGVVDPSDRGRRTLASPPTWLRDGLDIARQYLRLARRSRRI